MLDEVTVLIDSREKRPLLFPAWITWYGDRTLESRQIKVRTKVIRMPAGDYALSGYDKICLIETKRSLRELHNNVCEEWPRASKALAKLSKCKHPYIVWEVSTAGLYRPTEYVPDPALVIDRWMQAITRLNLRLMWVGDHSMPGPRRKLGEQIVRLMLAHVMEEIGPNGLRTTTRESKAGVLNRGEERHPGEQEQA